MFPAAPAGFGAPGARTGVNPVEAVVLGFTRWRDYRGRSSRSEYWWFFLFSSVASFILIFGLALVFPGTLDRVTGSYTVSPTVGVVQVLLYVVSIAVGLPLGIRRLHDSGKSWLFLLVGLIPFVGSIAVLVFLCQGTQEHANEWGAPPA